MDQDQGVQNRRQYYYSTPVSSSLEKVNYIVSGTGHLLLLIHLLTVQLQYKMTTETLSK